MMTQEYKSAKTSVNSKKVPALFRKIEWIEGTMNLDYGGGKFDTATEYLEGKGVRNMIYDPFNRDVVHNLFVLTTFGFDTATCANVLNVIGEEINRLCAVKNIWDRLKVGGKAYFWIYEGDKSGIKKIDKKRNSCQLNRKTTEYVPEVASLFGEENCSVHGQMIVAVKDNKRRYEMLDIDGKEMD